MQFLAYFIALQRGTDIDQPRFGKISDNGVGMNDFQRSNKTISRIS